MTWETEQSEAVSGFLTEWAEMIAAGEEAQAQALITDTLTLEGDEPEGAERQQKLAVAALLVGRSVDPLTEPIEEWLMRQHADQLFLWRELAREAAELMLGAESELVELLDAELLDGATAYAETDAWLDDEDEDDEDGFLDEE